MLTAWFVVRHKDITSDVEILTHSANEAEVAQCGRMVAARVFKRMHDLHPCTRVDVEFQALLTND